MKFFVTSASGFVGGVLARKLREQGHDVRAVERNPEKAGNLKAIGVDGVYHIAGWHKVGVHEKSNGEKVNIQGTCNVLELMYELKIPIGVYTSTVAVNSDF